MHFDIFISYSSQDKATADAACAKLEADGIRCWVAPRDVPPGAEWAGAIVDAIDHCRAMVLIFSSSANESKQIHREVQRAFDREVPVVPLRIENIAPERSLAYYMGPVHWLDALTPPLEQHLQKLVASVRPFVEGKLTGSKTADQRTVLGADVESREGQILTSSSAGRIDTAGTYDESDAVRSTGRRSGRGLMLAAALGVILIGATGIWLAEWGRTPVGPPSTFAPPQTPVPTPPQAARPPAAPAPAPGTPVPSSSSVATPLSLERERALKPKDTFTECDKCPEMIVVQAGRFIMGAPAGEPGHMRSEIPQHQVTIAKSFAVSRFTVTFDEWDACVADGGCNGYAPGDEGWGHGSLPVINVSWDDAKAFVTWLSRKTGKTYRLLSEAEREYVTRAGTTTPFWWGSSISTGQANYNGGFSYAGGTNGEYRQKTVSANSFQPNAWGLYQVHGNVWDWVEDCYDDSYRGAPVDGTAWISGDCTRHAVRGGSWHSSPQLLRSADRGWVGTGVRSSGVGFRLGRILLAP